MPLRAFNYSYLARITDLRQFLYFESECDKKISLNGGHFWKLEIN